VAAWKDSGTAPREEKRILSLAESLPSSYTYDERVSASRWFNELTNKTKHLLRKMRDATKALNLPKAERKETEMALMMTPGLYV
jgi:hypothetical protein